MNQLITYLLAPRFFAPRHLALATLLAFPNGCAISDGTSIPSGQSSKFSVTGTQSERAQASQAPPGTVGIIMYSRPASNSPVIDIYTCMGTLIAPQIILTASHCIKNKVTELAIVFYATGQVARLKKRSMALQRHPTEDVALLYFEIEPTQPGPLGLFNALAAITEPFKGAGSSVPLRESIEIASISLVTPERSGGDGELRFQTGVMFYGNGGTQGNTQVPDELRLIRTPAKVHRLLYPFVTLYLRRAPDLMYLHWTGANKHLVTSYRTFRALIGRAAEMTDLTERFSGIPLGTELESEERNDRDILFCVGDSGGGVRNADEDLIGVLVEISNLVEARDGEPLCGRLGRLIPLSTVWPWVMGILNQAQANGLITY